MASPDNPMPLGTPVSIETRNAWQQADDAARRAHELANRHLTADEELALECVTRAQPLNEIAMALDTTPQKASDTIARAIKKRATEHTELAERARVLFLERIELLVNAWMPAAAQFATPDKDAATVVLAALKQYAEVTGIKAPVKVSTETRITVDIEQRRAAVAASLQDYRARDIEGEIIE